MKQFYFAYGLEKKFFFSKVLISKYVFTESPRIVRSLTMRFSVF